MGSVRIRTILFIVAALACVSGCAVSHQQPTIELAGDAEMGCKEINASYANLAQFGTDGYARKNQLDKLSKRKKCNQREINWSVSATFYAD